MTHKQFLYIASPFTLFLLLLGYCAPKKQTSISEAAQVKQNYVKHIAHLDSTVYALEMAVTANASVAQIQSAFREARFAYKKIEFIAEYFNPYTTKSMNGAAIDEVEEDDPLQKIVLPTGFQVMEELLFPVYSPENKQAVLRETGVLKACVSRLQLVEGTTEMSDTHIFDAMRQQVFRIITLGISGFDSPVALHSIPEAAKSVASMQQAFSVYQPRLQKKSPQLSVKLAHTFSSAIYYLQTNSDFEDFDRADFILQYANALSELLLNAQQVLQISTPSHLQAVSPKAKTLFEPAAFNPDFYAPGYESHLSEDQIALGKMLFFDPVLSGNGSRSCASCHNPERAFTDGKAKSIAFDFKGAVSRNAPTILNAGLQRAAFHDMRVAFLEDQATDVLMNANEMHGSLQKAVIALTDSPEYIQLFQKAFPKNKDSTLLSERNLKIAIASYVRSLTSLNSPFDQYMRGDKTKLTATEKHGFNVFMSKAKCGTCHFMPLFNGTVPPDFDKTEAEILGVPGSKDTLHPRLDTDLGKFALYNKDLHKFAFKTPTLRNIALTAPYMHNGVYDTLEEVVEFYNKGGGIGLGMDVPTQTLPGDKLNLTLQEKAALIAFMRVLTDTTGLTNIPAMLPSFPKQVALNHRKIGGNY